MMPFRALPALLIVALLAPAAPAQTAGRADGTRLSIDVGWGNTYRAGRWTPIFLTVTDQQPRQVVADVFAPHGGAFAMRLGQSFVAGPSPVTYAVYLPLPDMYQFREATVTLRDARTNKRLATEVFWDDEDDSANRRAPPHQLTGQIFLGVSGRSSTARLFQGQFQNPNVAVDFLEPDRLPAVAAGYDALDVLVLNSPDLNRLAADQQTAIVEWVRAGGNLVLWPGEEPIPARGPLVDALPVTFGENRTIEVPPDAVAAANMPARFGKLRGRQLLPRPGAEAVPLFGPGAPDAVAYRGGIGFGRAAVLSIDGSSLLFNRTDGGDEGATWWRPVLAGMAEIPKLDPDHPSYSTLADGAQRRGAAVGGAMDWIGDIPGAGAFGFNYVAIVLLGMMAIVGPVDWFVLRRLGRQPWTWVTTTGWIVLVTTAAIYIGHVFKSGDLHYRTVRLTDQANGATVATHDVIGIYSPRTTSYDLAFDPDSWWQPGTDRMFNHSSGGMLNELRVHQDTRGCRPRGLRVNVWNLRFLEGASYAPQPPVIEATLAVTKAPDGASRLTGSLTNRGPAPLANVQVLAASASATLKDVTIAPGATVNVDAPLAPGRVQLERPVDANAYWNSRFGVQQTATVAAPTVLTAGELGYERSDGITRLLDAGHLCVLAEQVDPPPPVKLAAEGAIEKHVGFVRAVVPVDDGAAPGAPTTTRTSP